ncbi:MAG: hypothetical protein ABSD45_11555 [Terriglobia bacterium]
MTCPAAAEAERSVAKNLVLVAAMPRCDSYFAVTLADAGAFFTQQSYQVSISHSVCSTDSSPT